MDEIAAGIFDGMSYEEIEEQQPEEFRARKSDKLRYRCGARSARQCAQTAHAGALRTYITEPQTSMLAPGMLLATCVLVCILPPRA